MKGIPGRIHPVCKEDTKRDKEGWVENRTLAAAKKGNAVEDKYSD
jgi:hypothetical protein